MIYCPACVKEHTDMDGGLIEPGKPKPDVDACKEACTKNKACVAFSYNLGNKHCYLRHTGHKSPRHKNNWVTGIKSCYTGGGRAPKLGSGNFVLISHRQDTKQSSTLGPRVSSRAVDGNPDGRDNQQSLAHSREPKDNWWMVKFQSKYYVNLVVVYHDKQNQPDRINGAMIYAGTTYCGRITVRKDIGVYVIPCQGEHYLRLTIILISGDFYHV